VLKARGVEVIDCSLQGALHCFEKRWRLKRSIWIGFDPREADAFAVAVDTAKAHAPDIPVNCPSLDLLRKLRPLLAPDQPPRRQPLGRLISDAPMSTEFAISRFLTPILAGRGPRPVHGRRRHGPC
jgi:hypothetical protein